MKKQKQVAVESFVQGDEKNERIICGSSINFKKALKKGKAMNFRKSTVDISHLAGIETIEELKTVPKNRFAHVVDNKIVEPYIII